MARRERKSDKLPDGWLKGFIEAYDIQSTDDIKEALKDLVGGTVETMMEAELEADLGYVCFVNRKSLFRSRKIPVLIMGKSLY